MTKNLSLEDRFMSCVQKSDDPNGCWEWIRYKFPNGYGCFGRHYKAHRVSFELFIGPIPENLCVCHSCDNPGCVNPHHLFLGTHQDNMTDMIKKNRNKSIGQKGENNKQHKLTEQEIYEIREMRKCGYTLQEIANRFEVNFRTIHYITTDKLWKHLK